MGSLRGEEKEHVPERWSVLYFILHSPSGAFSCGMPWMSHALGNCETITRPCTLSSTSASYQTSSVLGFLTHEVYLGPKMGVDLTLMPEIHYAVIQRPPTEHIPRLSDPGPPDDGFFPHQPPGLVRMPDGKSADNNNADDAVLN